MPSREETPQLQHRSLEPSATLQGEPFLLLLYTHKSKKKLKGFNDLSDYSYLQLLDAIVDGLKIMRDKPDIVLVTTIYYVVFDWRIKNADQHAFE
jgi:hypothetical protein